MAMDSNGVEIVASKEKAKNGYGQNGYPGPSSDLPGQATRMDRDFGLKADPSAVPGDWQTRKVSAEPYATTHSMHPPAAPEKIGGGNIRQPSKRVMGGNFQR